MDLKRLLGHLQIIGSIFILYLGFRIGTANSELITLVGNTYMVNFLGFTPFPEIQTPLFFVLSIIGILFLLQGIVNLKK